MFEALPPETDALKALLVDLHDDLEGRVRRLRLLVALESDFGSECGLMLPGGTPARMAYFETRQAFISGQFLSVILLSQCVMENALAAMIGIQNVSREVHGGDPIRLKPKPDFRDTITTCQRSGFIDAKDADSLLQLSKLRNALSHYRNINDPTHLDRRSMDRRISPDALCEEDARFAITLFIKVLASREFRFGSP